MCTNKKERKEKLTKMNMIDKRHAWQEAKTEKSRERNR